MTSTETPARVSKIALPVLLALAFLVRLGVRLAFGETGFRANGYTAYYDLARNIVAGKGFCFDTACAEWPPLYPAFLALMALWGKHWLLIVVPQALMGAATAGLAFLIGREMFNPLTGLIACAITALYPYYVMHDTAIQESGMLTFCAAAAVWLLLRATRVNRNADWFYAGLALGSIALVRASPAPFILLALVWAAACGFRNKAFVALTGVALMVTPWLVRTWHVSGAPVLTSQTGSALWKGNNPQTFSHYPLESIDLSSADAFDSLTPRDNAELAALPNEIQQSDWFSRRAVAYMKTHPRDTLKGALRKIAAGFSWTLNPRREPLAEAAYRVGWIPVSMLGFAGIMMAWPRREAVLILLMFLSFIGVTAIFWAHTSHRSWLDLYLVVFAASVLEKTFHLPVGRKLRTFRLMDSGERRRALVVIALMYAVRIALWTVPFRIIRSFLISRPGPHGSRRMSTEQVRWAVELASRYVVCASCLTQAVTAQILFRLAGVGTVLRIGVRKAGGFKAHAWVECAEQVLIGGSEKIADYVPILSLQSGTE